MREWTANSITMVRQIRWRLETAPWPQLVESQFFRNTWERFTDVDRTHVLAQLAWAARHCTALVQADGDGMLFAARLHRDAQHRTAPGIMPGPRPSVTDQLVAAVILAASERALSVNLDAASEVPGPVLGRWTVLPEPTRAAAICRLARPASQATAPHEPTDTGAEAAPPGATMPEPTIRSSALVCHDAALSGFLPGMWRMSGTGVPAQAPAHPAWRERNRTPPPQGAPP